MDPRGNSNLENLSSKARAFRRQSEYRGFFGVEEIKILHEEEPLL